MPSPVHAPRSAVNSHGRKDSKGAAIRRGDLMISDPIQLPRGSHQRISNQVTTSISQLERTWPRKSVSPGRHMRGRSNDYNEPQVPHSASPSDDMLRISAGRSILNGSPTKQTDGGFRAKIRRMFGSKRVRESTRSAGSQGPHSQPAPHKSITVQILNSNPRAPTPFQPVRELTPSSALGSHSPEPQEQLQVSPQDVKTSNRAENPVSSHRRRNTLPSVSLSPNEAEMLAATLGEVGMTPSSKPPLHHSDGELARNLKRRSRSAEELRYEARSHPTSPIQWRRRSGEIQYWRNSVLENPVPGPSGMRRDAYHSSESERPPFLSLTASRSSVQRPASRQSLKQFRFGSYPSAVGHTTTVEERLTTLEVKFIDHEYAIAQLQGCDINKQETAAKVPKRRPVQVVFTETSDHPFSTQFANLSQTFLPSPADSPTPADDFDRAACQSRSSNAPTLKPIITSGASPGPHSDVSPSSNPITTEKFDAFMALIATEQAARRKLEERLAELQAQIDEFRSASYTPRRPSAYPTPSPESRHSIITFRGHPTWHPNGVPGSRVGSNETSRFSVTDADDSENEDGFLDTCETQESKLGLGSNRGSPTAGMI